MGQGQVLNYLKHLAKKGYRIALISFEKAERYRSGGDAIHAICHEAGIEWHPLSYTKKPPVLSTLFDIARLWSKLRKIHKEKPFSVVHCRGYVTAMVGLKAQRRLRLKFIFDMRGFWIDEKIESGEWKPNRFPFSTVIRFLRRKERQFYAEAQEIVTLTYAAQKHLLNKEGVADKKVTVIPTCVDMEMFLPYDEKVRQAVRAQLGIPQKAFVLLYSGGIEGNYDTSFLFKIFEKVRELYPESHLLVLTKDGRSLMPDSILQQYIHIRSLPFQEVYTHLYAGDIGIINYKNEFSVTGRSPTKLGEYWACGLPAIAPPEIGDLCDLFSRYTNAGMEFYEEDWQQKLRSLIQDRDTTRLRMYAEEYFSLEIGVSCYHKLYQKIGVVLNEN